MQTNNANLFQMKTHGDPIDKLRHAVQKAGIIAPSRKTEQLTLAGFVIVFIVMSSLCALAFYQARTFTQAAKEFALSQEILDNLERTRVALSSAETGKRGYLITGDSIFLESYQKAVKEIRPDLEKLSQLVPEEPRQRSLVTELSADLSARIYQFERVIAAFRTHGLKGAQALLSGDSELRQNENIYQTIDEILALEQFRLRNHQQQQEAAAAYLRYTIAALAGVLFLVLSIIYRRVQQSASAARQADQLLNSLNLSLEKRVAERTLQLQERTRELEIHMREIEEHSEKLEHANQQLESFSYSVSHDLRAPLRAISGFAQILDRRHRDQLNEQGRHFLDNIVQASGHMGQLIDDLLNYARLGRSKPTLNAVELGPTFARIAATLQPRVAETGATLVIPPDLPAVNGDRTLLGQIFTNLLDNALTYRRTDVATQVRVTWKRSGEYIVVSVADNGIGIAADQFENIFNVFQRLHRQDEYPGTGIGLAVVSKAADMQGGKVWLESSPGTGSTFHVQLIVANDD